MVWFCQLETNPVTLNVFIYHHGLLAQLVNENKNIIKGKFGVGITSKTKGDTFLKGHFRQMFLKCLCSEADFRNSLWHGLSDLGVLFTTPNVSQI